MTDITIPPAALEAAAEELLRTQCGGTDGLWAHAPEWHRVLMRNEARAACLTMLKAWPERRFRYERNGTYPVVVLPFEEITND